MSDSVMERQSEFKCRNCGLLHTARAVTDCVTMSLHTDGTVSMAFECRDCDHTNQFDYERQ